MQHMLNIEANSTWGLQNERSKYNWNRNNQIWRIMG